MAYCFLKEPLENPFAKFLSIRRSISGDFMWGSYKLCHSSQTALLSQTIHANTLCWKRSRARSSPLQWRRVDEYDYEEILRIAEEEWKRVHWIKLEEEFATEVDNKNDELG